jgi:tRNA(fMet)-specific endonuclease VapC
MKILDTDFLIPLFRGINSAVTKSKELDDEDLAITSISAFEMLFQTYWAGRDKEITHTKRFLFRYDVLALDSKSAGIAAKICTNILHKGKDIGLKDLFIAAIALSYNATILTRNVKHFRNIEELKVEEW